jgi:hypothetical protein
MDDLHFILAYWGLLFTVGCIFIVWKATEK